MSGLVRPGGWSPFQVKCTSSCSCHFSRPHKQIPAQGPVKMEGADGLVPAALPNNEDDSSNALYISRLEVGGHSSLTITADPLHKIYPYCIGNSLWTAAVELIRFMSDAIPDKVIQERYPRVLELGAGLGAVGMALARRGATDVLLTDREIMLPLLQYNVVSNFGDSADVPGPCPSRSVHTVYRTSHTA